MGGLGREDGEGKRHRDTGASRNMETALSCPLKTLLYCACGQTQHMGALFIDSGWVTVLPIDLTEVGCNCLILPLADRITSLMLLFFVGLPLCCFSPQTVVLLPCLLMHAAWIKLHPNTPHNRLFAVVPNCSLLVSVKLIPESIPLLLISILVFSPLVLTNHSNQQHSAVAQSDSY